MYLIKVSLFGIIASWDGQDFRERCGSFGGNSLPTLPAGSTWRKADGRRDLSVELWRQEDTDGSLSNAPGDRFVQVPAKNV